MKIKFLRRAAARADSFYRKILARAFRVTGWRFFITAYLWKRNGLLSISEIEAIASRLRLPGGSLLVFGAGNDSLFWSQVNGRAPTVFLESDRGWLRQVMAQDRKLRVHHVVYTTRVADFPPDEVAIVPPPDLNLPAEIRARRWDNIIVDAPQGWGDGPGRAQSIHEAGWLVAPTGRIFVHDCDREHEQHLVAHYLRDFHCEKITGRLWMFERPTRPPG